MGNSMFLNPMCSITTGLTYADLYTVMLHKHILMDDQSILELVQVYTLYREK